MLEECEKAQSDGVGGFRQYEINDIALTKNIDQLRVLSNPEVTYKQPKVGKGIDKRSVEGDVRKYRPHTLYIAAEDHYQNWCLYKG